MLYAIINDVLVDHLRSNGRRGRAYRVFLMNECV